MTLSNIYLKVSLFRTTNTMLIIFHITFSSFTTVRIVIRSFNIFSCFIITGKDFSNEALLKSMHCVFQDISSSLVRISVGIRG